MSPTITLDPTTNLLTLNVDDDPRPATIEVATEVLAMLIAEVNLGRLRARATSEVHTALGKVLRLGAAG